MSVSNVTPYPQPHSRIRQTPGADDQTSGQSFLTSPAAVPATRQTQADTGTPPPSLPSSRTPSTTLNSPPPHPHPRTVLADIRMADGVYKWEFVAFHEALIDRTILKREQINGTQAMKRWRAQFLYGQTRPPGDCFGWRQVSAVPVYPVWSSNIRCELIHWILRRPVSALWRKKNIS